MSFEFNLPNFQVETASERKMYSYLYQTVQQLNWAMKHIQTAEGSGNGYLPVKQVSQTGEVSDGKTPLETFSELKALIIKSADIVNAYYDTIHARLEGLYVAQSEFGDYVEATKLELEANSKGITQNYTNIQGIQVDVNSLNSSFSGIQTEVTDLWSGQTELSGTVSGIQGDITGIQGNVSTIEGNVSGVKDEVAGIQSNVSSVQGDIAGVKDSISGVEGNLGALDDKVDGLNTVIVKTNAYIRTGELTTDEYGIPIYGLEIGQTNEINGSEEFRKFARFSSSRLSFYDQNSTEVAYISDYKLYITNVHITGTLTIGEYEVDTTDGLIFRWKGVENA